MKNLYKIIAVALLSGSNLLCTHPLAKNKIPGDAMEDDARQRLEWEYKRLAGPDGTIPAHMREKELAFAATLPSNISLGNANMRSASQSTWTQRGPWNVGGRTRSLGIDALNENHLIAGTPSGGIWQSINGGTSWTDSSPIANYHGISCLVQDTRSGHEQTWYAGSGEPYGQSASGGGAYFLGNGMLKSTDNGATWSPVTATVTNSPQSFDSFWDMEWNIALDLHDTVNNVIYGANLGGIYKSINGGTTWTTVRGGNTSSYSYFTDVAVTKDSGIVYATLSSDGPVASRGIWRSTNQGSTWTHISTALFGDSLCNRVVMGINPSNENEIYFLGNTNGLGMADTNFLGDIEWNVLWRYTYLGGNGSGAGGMWEDLSMNLPNSERFGQFGDFNAQGSYDLVVRVKPNDPNSVFIGGTNVYRNTNRFNDTTNTRYIGGYLPYSALPVIASYPNHHPDQHTLTFLPSNPDVLYSTNDGGIFRTNDCTQNAPTWTSLNNGYLTSMFYTVAVDHATSGNNIIIGGAQDNGSWYTNNTNLTSPWVQPNSGDGSYCAIADNQSSFYFSIQNGKMRKTTLDAAGNVTSFARIDPIGATKYQFINPFVLDPNNNIIMYMAGGKYLWRNNDLSGIPMIGNWDSISTNWIQWADSVPLANSTITALAVCKTPANRVYYGTDKKHVFRVDNANTGTPVPLDISSTLFNANGFVSCVAVDPNNGDHVMVVFSNYSIYSLFYSADAGATWTKCAGNLEATTSGTGNGPSLRWASFLPVSDGMVYIVSTSVGVFATDTLMGLNTVWVNQAANTVGNEVCDMTDVRVSDGLVVMATHSHGIFSANITSVNDIATVHEYANAISMSTNIYPNPASDELNIAYNLPANSDIELILLDEMGRSIRVIDKGRKMKGSNLDMLNISDLAAGIYYVSIRAGELTETKAFVVAK
jgi:hypothetical protein